jgi:hypothetical protein
MRKSATLTDLLCQIKDKRRKQGTRHRLSDILQVVILGTMSGYYGYRALEDFCKRYENDLQIVLGQPKHGVPSSSCIRRVIMELDFNIVSQKFYQWIRGKVPIRNKEWLQIDGKGINGTVTNSNNKYQNYVNLVSLFMDRTGIVLNVLCMNNKEQNEIYVARELIKRLTMKNIVLSMDAAHCQKKRQNKSLHQAMII